MLISLVRTLIGIWIAVTLEIPFHGFTLSALELSLAGFFVNLLLMDCAIELIVAALVLHYGPGGRKHRLEQRSLPWRRCAARFITR